MNIVLELEKYDVKALYRRALARQKLNKIGPAFVDAKQALKIQPRDRFENYIFIKFYYNKIFFSFLIIISNDFFLKQ